MGAPGMNTTSQSTQSGGNRFKKFFRRNNSNRDIEGSVAESKGVSSSQSTYNPRSSQSNSVYDADNLDSSVKAVIPPSRNKSSRRSNKKGLLGGLLPVVKSKTEESTSREKSPSPEAAPPPVPLQHESVQLSSSVSNPQITPHTNEGVVAERIESIRPIHTSASGNRSNRRNAGLLNNLSMKSQRKSANNRDQEEIPSNSSSGEERVELNNSTGHQRESLFQWQDNFEKQEELAVLQQKQLIKERDGFCRRVDAYDGSIIRVEGKPAYELGNYLGGGVAGVVYEGHRLLGPEEYPVRLGVIDDRTPYEIEAAASAAAAARNSEEEKKRIAKELNSCLCVPAYMNDAVDDNDVAKKSIKAGVKNRAVEVRDGSVLTMDSSYNQTGGGGSLRSHAAAHTNDIALEATESTDGNKVIIDSVDAPSRSKHYAKAVTTKTGNYDDDIRSDASFMNGFMEESVAVKILNPVGFRTLSPDVTSTAVIAREGAPVDKEVYAGLRPMEERHVWWLINPSSRNLRTLQRYTADRSTVPAGVQVDRGSAEKGLRISLIASYKDVDGVIKELPLTRCIEIWGHVPFEASDAEFKEVMTAIDRVNQGLPPPPIPAFLSSTERKLLLHTFGGEHDDGAVPGRIGTATSSITGSISTSLEELKLSNNKPVQLLSARTGIYRAAFNERQTVFCAELQAYIAIPAVPSKYIKWLRQRRAVTKEVRNMTKLGRHKNVVHLFEVLELIQETKSTMFLILELVRGGELFDLISSNAAKISSQDIIPKGFSESETVMRKFFTELVSGIHYCHTNFIAHRDLKPENLLVHYDSNQVACTLKIADFGLSATFGPNGEAVNDNDTIIESVGSGLLTTNKTEIVESPTLPVSPIKQQMDKFLTVGGNALAFFTCGAVDDVMINCGPNGNVTAEDVEIRPMTLKRMTSVVGSPHYVAPEIISQQDKKSRKKGADGHEQVLRGYDGTKADVWSAGVILYAMLFRSLPFGEDLLRCPRFQSYKKWYDDIRMTGGPRCRRGNLLAPLNPVISRIEEQEFLGPHWFFPSDSSSESRDLIVYMLNPDPDRRPSIQLVLRHPWLLKKGTPPVAPS